CQGAGRHSRQGARVQGLEDDAPTAGGGAPQDVAKRHAPLGASRLGPAQGYAGGSCLLRCRASRGDASHNRQSNARAGLARRLVLNRAATGTRWTAYSRYNAAASSAGNSLSRANVAASLSPSTPSSTTIPVKSGSGTISK